MKNKELDIIILGGGPAGAQCALWVHHLGYKTVIIEKDQLGGLQSTSPYKNNWLVTNEEVSGIEIAENIKINIKKNNISVEKNQGDISIVMDNEYIKVKGKKFSYRAKFLVIATGTIPRDGGIKKDNKIIIGPGAQIENIDFSNKSVAILGGGDNAVENYLFIKEKNPKLIQIYARHIRARKNLYSFIEKNSVYIGEYGYKNGKIESQLGSVSYDIIIVLYGWKANYPEEFVKNYDIQITSESFIKVDNFCKTSMDNVYAIGDVTHRNHPSVATAIADGVIAAKDICDRLEKL